MARKQNGRTNIIYRNIISLLKGVEMERTAFYSLRFNLDFLTKLILIKIKLKKIAINLDKNNGYQIKSRVHFIFPYQKDNKSKH